MQSMKKVVVENMGIKLIGLVLGAFALAGCSDTPSVPQSTKENIEGTKFEVTRVKEPVDVDGCKVSVYRLTSGQSSLMPNFTFARAKCDGQDVEVAVHGCGKSCMLSNVAVSPTTPLKDRANSIEQKAAGVKDKESVLSADPNKQPAVAATAKEQRLKEIEIQLELLRQEVSALKGEQSPTQK